MQCRNALCAMQYRVCCLGSLVATATTSVETLAAADHADDAAACGSIESARPGQQADAARVAHDGEATGRGGDRLGEAAIDVIAGGKLAVTHVKARGERLTKPPLLAAGELNGSTGTPPPAAIGGVTAEAVIGEPVLPRRAQLDELGGKASARLRGAWRRGEARVEPMRAVVVGVLRRVREGGEAALAAVRGEANNGAGLRQLGGGRPAKLGVDDAAVGGIEDEEGFVVKLVDAAGGDEPADEGGGLCARIKDGEGRGRAAEA